MQDEYTGLSGTFIIDAEKGIRMPLEQYEAEQAEKAAQALKAVPVETLSVTPAKVTKPSEVN
jgi:hypothetical protein